MSKAYLKEKKMKQHLQSNKIQINTQCTKKFKKYGKGNALGDTEDE